MESYIKKVEVNMIINNLDIDKREDWQDIIEIEKKINEICQLLRDINNAYWEKNGEYLI